MEASRIESPGRGQGDGDRRGRDRRRRAPQPRRGRGEDDHPLDLRRALPRAGPQPARRTARARPDRRPLDAALARDPRRLRPLPRRLHLPRARGDPADRPRGRAAGLASCRPTSRTSRHWANNNVAVPATSTTSTTSPPCSRPGGCPTAVQARRRGRRGEGDHGRDPQQHRRGGRGPHPDLLPAARRARPFGAITARIREPQRERVRRVATRIAGIVKSYVSVNLLLAALAGVFTWLALELLGVDLAVPTRGPGRASSTWCR